MSEPVYVERHDGVYRIRGTRVSLDSVVYAFLNGEPAESIVHSFPVLELEQVYGAIAYYLAHQTEVDAYLKEAREDYEQRRQAARERNPELYRKLAEAKARRVASS